MAELALQLWFLVKHLIQQTPSLLLKLPEGIYPKLLFQILYILMHLRSKRLYLSECFLAFLYISSEKRAAGAVCAVKASFTTCLYKAQIASDTEFPVARCNWEGPCFAFVSIYST